jgi:DNA-binding MarR family transcriptional regulator
MNKPPSFELPLEGRLFLHAQKLVNERVDKDLRSESPLSATEFEVLWRINYAGGRLRFINLAHDVKLSQSRVSRQVDSLERKGYVLREATNQNRRATFAVMTDKGQAAYEAAEQPFQKAWRTHFFARISPDDLEVFKRVLMSLIGDVPLPP